MTTDTHPTTDQSDTATLLRATFLVKRRSDFDYEAFVDYQEAKHVPLVFEIPGLRRYVLDYFPPGPDGDQAFDAAAHVFFDDQAAFDAGLGSPQGQRALADLQHYLDESATVSMVGREAIDNSF